MISCFYHRKILVILVCCVFMLLCFPGKGSYARLTRVNYQDEAYSAFSKAREKFYNARFHEAYEHYDEAASAARRAINFGGLNPNETLQMKELIRQVNNQKREIVRILDNFKTLISEKKVARGMTPEQVRSSWGEPNDIKQQFYQWKETQEWHYGNIITDNDKYVFFSDGIVVDWNDKTKE